ncbi:hypothetical protein TEQG_07170 [Trichophyton equinum CBS 127.97]|uniref:Uncharacterized protein n=1 Tax=Trichophyton equinum (strain ATCC MYA-4606 / CBS 127.97) TaxID=559882 RepID=F2Q275_TRIEC|nr:hypothetical protein TEQG_07170 [Trichophyton equinum CBS 127.97]
MDVLGQRTDPSNLIPGPAIRGEGALTDVVPPHLPNGDILTTGNPNTYAGGGELTATTNIRPASISTELAGYEGACLANLLPPLRINQSGIIKTTPLHTRPGTPHRDSFWNVVMGE